LKNQYHQNEKFFSIALKKNKNFQTCACERNYLKNIIRKIKIDKTRKNNLNSIRIIDSDS
jgi:hypothetical protein